MFPLPSVRFFRLYRLQALNIRNSFAIFPTLTIRLNWQFYFAEKESAGNSRLTDVGIAPKSTAVQLRNRKMLVLSRYRDESIYIGDDIIITVVDIRGDRVRIGVQAPPDVSVHRQEVYEAIKSEREPGSFQRKPERTPTLPHTLPKPVVAPLSQELSKRKARLSTDAKVLPVDVVPPVEFGGLTSDIVTQ